MDQGEYPEEYIDLVDSRFPFLRLLADGACDPRTIRERADASRATVNRALRDLTEAGLVERAEGRYALTAAGRLAFERARAYRREAADIASAADLLRHLPGEVDLHPDLLVGSEVVVPPEGTPYEAGERLGDELEAADRVRAALPVIEDRRWVGLLFEHVVTDEAPAALVVPPGVHESLAAAFPRRLSVMADTDRFELFAGDLPPYGLVLTEVAGEPTVTVAVFGDGGGIRGLVRNDSPRAVDWAERACERLRDRADPVTDALDDAADGGVLATAGPTDRDSVPTGLEREGFVRLSTDYFAARPVAEPATAWRAGLDLAEVHTGYAVARPEGDGDDDPPAGDAGAAGQRGLAASLRTDLLDGHCVLLGSPASGKSTVCKQVACDWYDGGRGAVLYRRGGRGQAFESVDALVETARRTAGRTLVVVEDALEPDAVAVFDALARLDPGDEVSVLLDAREAAWRDPDAGPDRDAFDLAVHTVPALREQDCERFVERFERTVGEAVAPPAERLHEAIREEAAADREEDTAGASEVLLLAHRLARYADPLAEGETSLEEEVATVHGRLREAGEDALDVAVLANVLNAAGVGFGPGLLHAVAAPADRVAVEDGAADAPVGGGAVEAAREVLDGRVLFGRADDGTFRTVHGEWSAVFLEHLLEAGDAATAARERVSRVLSSVLALADDAERRDRLRRRQDHSAAMASLDADPDGWAADTVDRLFRLAVERPALAPLFGTEEGPGVEFPAALDAGTRVDCRVALGRAFLDAGAYDRAEALFEGLAGADRSVDRRLGLAEAARGRGDYGTARGHVDACLAAAGEPLARARTLLESGRVAVRADEYDHAREDLERALETFEDRDATRWTAHCLRELGRVAETADEYDRARKYAERSLETARELGDRQLELDSHNTLGIVAGQSGEFERAQEHIQRTVELATDLGYRRSVAVNLMNLGLVSKNLGEYDRARDCFERALADAPAIGYRRGEAQTLSNLGLLERAQGNYEVARERFRAGLERCREIGYRRGEAICLENLGELAGRRGALDEGRRHAESGLGIVREIDYRRGEGQLLDVLSRLVDLAAPSDTGATRSYCDRATERIEGADIQLDDLAERFLQRAAGLEEGAAD